MAWVLEEKKKQNEDTLLIFEATYNIVSHSSFILFCFTHFEMWCCDSADVGQKYNHTPGYSLYIYSDGAKSNATNFVCAE